VLPEVMIPLTGTRQEMANQAAVVRRVAEKVFAKKKEGRIHAGTMIESSRAAWGRRDCSGSRSFSRSQNDLTKHIRFFPPRHQQFLPDYMSRASSSKYPFACLTRGRGQLVKMATERGRKSRRNLKVGICGEHGGDPSSVEFCHQIG